MGEPQQIVRDLESQLDDILQMYDLAEKTYPYQNMRGGSRDLNEDAHRRSMVHFSQYGLGSSDVLAGGFAWGLMAAFLFTRRGSAHWMDFAPIRQDLFKAASYYMVGVSGYSFWRVIKASEGESARRLNLHRRVAQNEQTHSILRSMKFHLSTRQMGLWDAAPR